MNNIQLNSLKLRRLFQANNIPTGSTVPSGIIDKIRSHVHEITSHVEPTKNGYFEGTDAKPLVNWSSYIQVYMDGAYLQIEFKYGYVFPTSYSIKGTKQPWCYAKNWILYGFNTAEEQMTVISTNQKLISIQNLPIKY